MEILLLARKMTQNRKHDISSFSVHAVNQNACDLMILYCSIFILKTPAEFINLAFAPPRNYQNNQNTT